jgi:hypothetical protein
MLAVPGERRATAVRGFANYKRRRIRDRFTREMLLDYLAALGIRGDDPSFFTEGVLAVDTGSWLPGWTGTLEEARTTST